MRITEQGKYLLTQIAEHSGGLSMTDVIEQLIRASADQLKIPYEKESSNEKT